jgi:aspartyl aminopeptidase
MTPAPFNQHLFEFLDTSVTPFHAVAAMVNLLQEAGFVRLAHEQDWSVEPGGRYFLTRNDSSIVAFAQGRDRVAADGVRMVGAHTDSPCLMLKPAAALRQKGYFQLGVQVYGGALLNPWFDRDLSLAGRVSLLNGAGQLQSVLINFQRPVGIIPSLAIHLDREANASRSVNAQTDLPVVVCQLAEDEAFDVQQLLLQRIGEEHPSLAVQEVLDFELSFFDTQPAATVGLNGDFIASARLDNLLSCFVGLQALLKADGSENALLVCNDHEEVGSQSASGAQGPLLASCLRRWAGSEDAHAAMIGRSMMVSADNAHGVHPNFIDRHDDNHGPLLNAGPVIKVNANQRYATNSETSSLFRLLCRQQSVPVQSFVVRSDMGCGSTIGPITAGATGVRTLDVGVPTFAMHSIRELAGSADAANLARVLQHFYSYPAPLF